MLAGMIVMCCARKRFKTLLRGKLLPGRFSGGEFVGRGKAYSGEGINLLQFVEETITGRPLEQLMQELVFQPLGMTRTSMVWQDRFENDFANNYDENGKALAPPKWHKAFAAGSMLTTVADCSRFIEAVLDGNLVRKRTLEQMLGAQIEITSRYEFPTLSHETTDENKGRYNAAMFIGHFAVGFASKRFAPRTSFALLLAAPLLSDILWPVLLLLGWEHARVDPGNTKYTPLDLYDFPWSHSLLMCSIWATLFATVYYTISRYRAGGIAIWLGVISHWVLDWISHGRDMPLYPGSAKYGLGLWNSIWGTMTVEITMFAIGIGLYVNATRARDRIGRWAFIIFVALNFVFYIADRYSPPPANMSEVAWPGVIASAVLLPWAWWFDRHREAT